MNAGVVIYGPPGCGKTRHAQELARRYGKRQVIDPWSPGEPLPDDAIALTNAKVSGAVHLEEAFAGAGQ